MGKSDPEGATVAEGAMRVVDTLRVSVTERFLVAVLVTITVNVEVALAVLVAEIVSSERIFPDDQPPAHSTPFV